MHLLPTLLIHHQLEIYIYIQKSQDRCNSCCNVNIPNKNLDLLSCRSDFQSMRLSLGPCLHISQSLISPSPHVHSGIRLEGYCHSVLPQHPSLLLFFKIVCLCLVTLPSLQQPLTTPQIKITVILSTFHFYTFSLSFVNIFKVSLSFLSLRQFRARFNIWQNMAAINQSN